MSNRYLSTRRSFLILPIIPLMLALGWIGCTSGDNPRRHAADPSEPKIRLSTEDRTLLYEARRAFREGRLRSALRFTDSLEARTDELAPVSFLRGRILSELRLFGPAADAFRTTIERDSTMLGAWFQLGHSAYRRGEYRHALSAYRRELQLRRKLQPDSTFPGIFLQIGRTYRQLNEPDSAVGTYRSALEARPQYGSAHADLSETYRTTGDMHAALQHARRALASDSANAFYRYQIGATLLQLGRPEAALPHLRAAEQSMPGHRQTVYNLGQALLRAGRPDQAGRYLARADSLSRLEDRIAQARVSAEGSRDAKRWIELGRLLRRARRPTEAREAFRIALEMNPSSRAARRQLRALRR